MKQNKIPRNEYIIKPKGKTNPYKHDVVYTNLGQWKYPGQVTKIPSNQITMQGVDYPVHGIDDTGYSQMMYPGMDYTFPGEYVTEYPMAQNGAQVEDNDSWLENISEIVDPTGISSWDDIYRAYKNSGVGKELALESLGAIPFLGKVSKVTKPGIHLTKYSGIDQILKNTLPRNKSLSRAANVASKTGRGTDAVQAVLGAKDNSGFTWDLRHGEVPKYGGRNIFPQADLGEHGDYAYGGSSDMYPFGGIHTKTDTHMATGGWLDTMQVGGQKPWGEMTAQERAAYLNDKESLQKQNKKADIQANEAERKSGEQAKKEYYKDWVAENYNQGAMNPAFQTIASFSPWGAIPYAMQSGASALNNLAQGNNLEAGIDAAFAFPLFKGLKGAKIIPKTKAFQTLHLNEYGGFYKKQGGWLDIMQKGGTKKFVQNVSIPYSIQGPYKDVVQTWKDDAVNPIDENLLTRQQYKESTFNPKAVSPRNARGLAQIMPDVENDAIKAGIIKKGQSVYDPKVNKKIQKWYMDNLYNASFINKPGVNQDDSVKMAKTLAAYNWGRGNLKKFLGEQKSKGIDIYNSYDWTKNLPKETSDYVNAILLKKNPVFEKDYDKAIENYEYRRGGQKGLKKYTSKNVFSSVNDIMLRNEKVFGPAGKRRYKPGLNYKDGGGWLDNMY